MLWEALEYVERQAPQGARVAWMSGDGLNAEEGIHFQWHLNSRGRGDIHLGLYDELGRPLRRVEMPPLDGEPVLAVSAGPGANGGGDWQVRQRFADGYWGGLRRCECYLLQPALESPRIATRALVTPGSP